jgi:hypothetical protein
VSEGKTRGERRAKGREERKGEKREGGREKKKEKNTVGVSREDVLFFK